MDPLWTILVILASLGVLANLLSLRQGWLLRSGVRRGLRLAFGAYLPRVAILLPVRGLEEAFDENLHALLSQEYPQYRLLVIADDAEDPAVARIRDLSRGYPRVPVEFVRSDAAGMGGKVNALRTALSRIAPDDEVVAFADADIRPSADWLKQLVQPLADATVGVATGFRWYVPPRPSFWPLVRSEWNAVSANVLFDPNLTYAWGGSSAVRAEVLPRLRLEERWRNVLSDDLVLTRAVREAGLRIAFAPPALVATVEGGDRRSCLAWCYRQMTMAVLYQPRLRRYAATAFAVFNGSVVLGMLSLLLASWLSWAYLVPAALFLVTMPATVVKASLRRRALFSAAPHVAGLWQVPALHVALVTLAVPWIMMAGLIRTRRPAVVRWRGRAYDVRDPRRVRLITTEAVPAAAPGTSTAR